MDMCLCESCVHRACQSNSRCSHIFVHISRLRPLSGRDSQGCISGNLSIHLEGGRNEIKHLSVTTGIGKLVDVQDPSWQFGIPFLSHKVRGGAANQVSLSFRAGENGEVGANILCVVTIRFLELTGDHARELRRTYRELS